MLPNDTEMNPSDAEVNLNDTEINPNAFEEDPNDTEDQANAFEEEMNRTFMRRFTRDNMPTDVVISGMQRFIL